MTVPISLVPPRPLLPEVRRLYDLLTSKGVATAAELFILEGSFPYLLAAPAAVTRVRNALRTQLQYAGWSDRHLTTKAKCIRTGVDAVTVRISRDSRTTTPSLKALSNRVALTPYALGSGQVYTSMIGTQYGDDKIITTTYTSAGSDAPNHWFILTTVESYKYHGRQLLGKNVFYSKRYTQASGGGSGSDVGPFTAPDEPRVTTTVSATPDSDWSGYEALGQGNTELLAKDGWTVVGGPVIVGTAELTFITDRTPWPPATPPAVTDYVGANRILVNHVVVADQADMLTYLDLCGLSVTDRNDLDKLARQRQVVEANDTYRVVGMRIPTETWNLFKSYRPTESVADYLWGQSKVETADGVLDMDLFKANLADRAGQMVYAASDNVDVSGSFDGVYGFTPAEVLTVSKLPSGLYKLLGISGVSVSATAAELASIVHAATLSGHSIVAAAGVNVGDPSFVNTPAGSFDSDAFDSNGDDIGGVCGAVLSTLSSTVDNRNQDMLRLMMGSTYIYGR